jgi:hypothetical protein
LKKKPVGGPAIHPRGREIPNDGRPSAGRRAAGGRDPLADGATTTVTTGPAHDAVAMLQSEHRTIAALFDRASVQPSVLSEIRRELERHAALEEEIFYPAVGGADGEGAAAIRDARAQHGEILKALGTRALAAPALATARATVERHVEFEERVVFAKALQALGKDALVTLAERMEQRNRELGGTLPRARTRRGKGSTKSL